MSNHIHLLVSASNPSNLSKLPQHVGRRYLSLGNNSKQRARCYRESFRAVLDGELINEIRTSVQTGRPLGNTRFKSKIEQLLGVKVGQARAGPAE
jgi:hypothetical protein